METTPALLEIRDLHVSAEDGAILRGVDLTVGAGEVHALMGPNGAGKSTLAGALLGHPAYTVTEGAILLNGEDVTGWSTDVRAKAGMFLAFQYPETIEGVSVTQFLRQAMAARKDTEVSVLEVRVLMTEWMERLGMDSSFASRHLNQGFSGGEKKRNEILQMALLEPLVAVLDETDSGLDIDALRVVGRGVRAVREARPELGVLAITHYERLLTELVPDVVHILVDGRIVASGGPELAATVETVGLRGVAMTAPLVGGRRGGGPAQRGGPAQGLPAADPHGQRATDRLPRLGLLRAAAAVRHQRHDPLLRDDPRQRAPRRLRHGRGGDGALRAGPGGDRPLHRRARTGPRDRLHQEHDRVAEPGGALVGPGQPAGGRRRAPDRDGAPRQHRAVDDPVRGDRWSRPALHPDRR